MLIPIDGYQYFQSLQNELVVLLILQQISSHEMKTKT